MWPAQQFDWYLHIAMARPTSQKTKLRPGPAQRFDWYLHIAMAPLDNFPGKMQSTQQFDWYLHIATARFGQLPQEKPCGQQIAAMPPR